MKLGEEKRKRIEEAFLREFAVNSYDEASLSDVVKKLGIAKGSIYQYFEDKLDLFMYLVHTCNQVKLRYVGSVAAKGFPDFWAYFRKLFELGYQFDAENPLQSHFLHNLVRNVNSPSVRDLYDELMLQSVRGFGKMVAMEIELGRFRDDLPVSTMGFMLFRIGTSIQEQLEVEKEINPGKSIEDNVPVYQGKREVLMQTVDNYIKLVRPAFDK